MNDHQLLEALAQAISRHRNGDVIDAEYEPRTGWNHSDYIDMIEHLENERAARDCGCECD